MKKLKIMAVTIVVALSCLLGGCQATYEETKVKELFKHGNLVQAYDYRPFLGSKTYILVFKSDSLITEVEVTPGVYYTYYKILEHEGFILR